RAVRVRRLTEGEAGRREARLADSWQRVVDRARARDHAMLGALDAAGAGESRLVVNGQPLRQPGGIVLVREEIGGSAEDKLREPPHAARAIEMKDVRQLVSDDHRAPVVSEAQR